MSEAKHTPAPWNAIIAQEPWISGVRSKEGFIVEAIAPYNRANWSNRHADLHMMAASPDMYEALEFFLNEYAKDAASGDWGNWDYENDEAVIKARAALAKARGAA